MDRVDGECGLAGANGGDAAARLRAVRAAALTDEELRVMDFLARRDWMGLARMMIERWEGESHGGDSLKRDRL